MNALNFGRRASVFLLAATAFAGSAHAATQGSLGATSTGSVDISASMAKQVRISGLADVTFTNPDPDVLARRQQTVCVWSNGAAKKYSIKATGSGASGAYTLKDTASTATIPYSVLWVDTNVMADATTLASGAARAGQDGNTNSTVCANTGENASLAVEIASADLQTMVGGATYTGTLSLLVSPD